MAIDPLRYFINNKAGAVEGCPLLAKVFDLAAAPNQQIIAAVTGKKIRVMGFQAQTQNAAAGAIQFEDGSGGADLIGNIWCPPLTNGDQIFWPITDTGYFETTVSVGLFADIATQSVSGTVFYITYTP